MKSLVFLGTGSSLGSPVIGCPCSVCKSPQLHNHRLRSSCLIEWEGQSFLIDPGPDLRQQCLRQAIQKLDGVLITHTHFDHVGGLDDLRIFPIKQKKPLPCLMQEESLQALQETYPYLFSKPYFAPQFLQGETGSTLFEGLPVRYVTYEQMGMKVCGFILGTCAYISDIQKYPESIIDSLMGVDTLILSAVRGASKQENLPKAHFSLEEAVLFSQRIKAKKVFLTHLSHDIDYEETTKWLPAGISLAFDGLTIPIKE